MRRDLRHSSPAPSELDHETHRRFVDELMDHYVSWREACAGVTAAYERYEHAPREDRRVAFGAYLSALDREAEAAATYQGAVERIARLRQRGAGVG